MPRVDFRTVEDRFGHMDGEFVAASLGWPQTDPFIAFRYYPWWEHPLYRAARERGEPWGLTPVDASKEVRIHPIGLREFRLTANTDYTDASFTRTHPLLWDYESEGQVFCNEPLGLFAVGREVEERVAHDWGAIARARLSRIFDSEHARRLGENRSFSLRLPRTIHRAFVETLRRLGKEHIVQAEPKDTPVPWMFYVDESNYLIADHFEVDMPSFEHKPEWFTP